MVAAPRADICSQSRKFLGLIEEAIGKNDIILAFGMKPPAKSFLKAAERDVKTTKSLGPTYFLVLISFRELAPRKSKKIG